MDWIERLFHISPDGGSGSLEMAIFVGLAIAVAMVLAKVVNLVPRARKWSKALMRRDRRPNSTMDRFG